MKRFKALILQGELEVEVSILVQDHRVDATILRRDQIQEVQELIPNVPVELFSIQILRWDDKREIHLDHIHVRFGEFNPSVAPFWKGFGKRSLCSVLGLLESQVYGSLNFSQMSMSLKAMASVGKKVNHRSLPTEEIIEYFEGITPGSLLTYLREKINKRTSVAVVKLDPSFGDTQNINPDVLDKIFTSQPKLRIELEETVAKYNSQRSLEAYYTREYGFSIQERVVPDLPKQPYTFMKTSVVTVLGHC
jgi:hypothetical protein